jgi:hypothetical protein
LYGFCLKSESVILVGATLFPGSSLALGGVPVEFDDTSSSLAAFVRIEEVSDLVRLALGGLVVPFPNSELEGRTDENEDRAGLLRVNAASKFPVLLDDPKDWSDLLRPALWPIEDTLSVDALLADLAAITEPEGDMETLALLS